MKVHLFQHVPFEGLGVLENWCRKPGNSLTSTKFFEDQKLPFVDICDVLIVMGGPMGVNEEQKYPWLAKEKEFIERALEKGKKVIGVCLGAQLIADVLGAKVYPNKEKEIGWFPIEITPEGKNIEALKDFPEKVTAFHWHGDTFDIPSHSTRLFKSEACPNQAFEYNHQALGLQFHMEMNEENIRELINNCRGDLTDGPYVQSEQDLIRPDLIKNNNLLIEKLVTNFIND